MLFQTSFTDQLLVFAGPIFPELLQGHPAGEDNRIHGEPVGPEMRVEEVDREDEPGRQQRLVRVDDRGHVDEPPRQHIGEQLGEPKNEPTETDHADTPENGEIIELLPVGPTTVLRPVALVQEPLHRLDEFHAVPPVEHHPTRAENEFLPALAGLPATTVGIVDMPDEVEEGQAGTHAVQGPRGLETAQGIGQPLGPGQIGELQRHPGDRQGQEADDHCPVQHPLQAVEPTELFFTLGLVAQPA